MRRMRFLAFALISFVAALFGTFLSPSTWLHKSLAVALCGVLSANPTLCTNNAIIASQSQEASATNPVKVETTQSNNLLAQRSRDFDDDTPKSPPRPNPTPPSYQNNSGANIPLRRSDFDDDSNSNRTNSSQISPKTNLNQNQSNSQIAKYALLSGTWIFSLYVSPNDKKALTRKLIKIIPIQNNKYKILVCKSTCGKLPSKLITAFNTNIKEKSFIVENDKISLEIIESIDGQSIWGITNSKSTKDSLYYSMTRMLPTATTNQNKNLSKSYDLFDKQTNSLILAGIGGINGGGNILPTGSDTFIRSTQPNLNINQIPRTPQIDQFVNATNTSSAEQAATVEQFTLESEQAANAAQLARAEQSYQRYREIYSGMKAVGDQFGAEQAARSARYAQQAGTVESVGSEASAVTGAAEAETLAASGELLAAETVGGGLLGELALAALATVGVVALIAGIVLGVAYCYENYIQCSETGKKIGDTWEKIVRWATSWGDPHLVTFDGLRYDHQSVGEFILSKSTDGAFEIQVREAPVAGSSSVSLNTAAAMKVGNTRVAFYAKDFPDSDTNNPLRINGKPTVIQGGSLSLPNGGSIRQANQNSYIVQWPTGEQVSIETGQLGKSGYLNVNPGLPQSRQGKVTGLLGDFNGNQTDDLRSRDGQVLPPQSSIQQVTQVTQSFASWIPIPLNQVESLFLDQLNKQFGDSWRISQAESLFDYPQGKNTDSYTNRAFPNGFQILRMLLPQQVQMAEQACRTAGVPAERLEGCLFDVGATGDVDFANIAANIATDFVKKRINEEIQRRIPIPVQIPGLPF